MYIEVFLLDNLLMNAVICVLAGAVCGRSVRSGAGAAVLIGRRGIRSCRHVCAGAFDAAV